MILFIVPLVSPEVAYSWNRACQLCERTLRSICNQTSIHFRVIAVCNHKPKINFIHPNIEYLEIVLPLPELTKEGKTLDRGYKVLHGVQQASGSKFSHVMVVDADDCISKHLVEYVLQNFQYDALFIDKGYVYHEGTNILFYRGKTFHRICGSCHILKYHLYDKFYNLPGKNVCDEDFIYKYYGEHNNILPDLIQKKLKLFFYLLEKQFIQ